MSEWEEKPLDEIVQFQRGHDLTIANIQNGLYPVAGSNGVIGFHNQFTTEGPSLTLGRSGNSIGVAHYYENDFWAHNTTLYSKKFINSWPKYVYYFLRTIDFSILNSGSAVPSLNRNHIHKISVKVPSLNEQKAIASVLSSLDDKIDLLHRQNITLERMAETLFRQWFVEEAQEDWEEVDLGSLVKIQRGISYSSKTLGANGVGIPMHSLNSVNINGDYKYEGIKTFIGKPKENQLLKPGDLLIINTDITPDNRIIGWPIFVPDKFEKSVCTHHLYMVDLISKKVTKLFLFFLLKSKIYREEMANASNGTTVSMLSKSAVENIRLKIPEIEKIHKFEDIANKLLEKKALNQSQIETLEKLRDNLLPKLMSGEVRVEA